MSVTTPTSLSRTYMKSRNSLALSIPTSSTLFMFSSLSLLNFLRTTSPIFTSTPTPPRIISDTWCTGISLLKRLRSLSPTMVFTPSVTPTWVLWPCFSGNQLPLYRSGTMRLATGSGPSPWMVALPSILVMPYLSWLAATSKVPSTEWVIF